MEGSGHNSRLIQETIGTEFTKHIVDLGFPHPGLAIHHFHQPDLGDPHDHPWGFTSHVLIGGYVEEIFMLLPSGGWRSRYVWRLPGSAHTVNATHVHRIVRLLEPLCVTAVLAGPVERDFRFWQFAERIRSRAWNEEEWTDAD
jgi:hypothetical protein